MSYNIRYQPRASREYESAADWYKERSEQAAMNFSLAVKDRIELLKKDPTRFGKGHKDFREVKLKKYPFSIVFLVEETLMLVVISSIFHHKRSPRAKFRNL